MKYTHSDVKERKTIKKLDNPYYFKDKRAQTQENRVKVNFFIFYGQNLYEVSHFVLLVWYFDQKFEDFPTTNPHLHELWVEWCFMFFMNDF